MKRLGETIRQAETEAQGFKALRLAGLALAAAFLGGCVTLTCLAWSGRNSRTDLNQAQVHANLEQMEETRDVDANVLSQATASTAAFLKWAARNSEADDELGELAKRRWTRIMKLIDEIRPKQK